MLHILHLRISRKRTGKTAIGNITNGHMEVKIGHDQQRTCKLVNILIFIETESWLTKFELYSAFPYEQSNTRGATCSRP